MDKDISFRRLKAVIKSKGLSLAEVAEKCGKKATEISNICNDRRVPKTDFLAKICSVLQVYPSEVVSFDGITLNEKYFSSDKRELLPNDFIGDVTYKPLWFFLADYLASYNENLPKEKHKSAKDLFDGIEPPRRLNGQTSERKDIIKKAVAAKYGEGYVSERKNRTDYSKGLPAITRTKLRNDRPINLQLIYEICKKLGCTIDFVMSYK